jgi:hypothetical protein
MDIGTKVRLSDWEWDMARSASDRRQKSNLEAGSADTRKDESRSDEDIHLVGCASEIAFCRGFNVYCDLVQGARLSKDDDGDAVVRGLLVDVKSTHHRNGRLVVPSWKSPVGLYALMVGEARDWMFKGFMTGARLIVPERKKVLVEGGNECYVAGQEELVNFEEYVLCPK